MITEPAPDGPTQPPVRRRTKPLIIGGAVAFIAVIAILAVAVFEVHTLFVDDQVTEAGPAFDSGATLDRTDDGSVGNAPVGDEGIGAEGDEGVTVTKVADGVFEGREHDGEGNVVVLTDGRQTFVRFEDDFATSNGPDLYAVVYVDGERVELGKLKGNEGSQNYELPSDIDPGSVEGVAVWCKRFDATFTEADLS